MTAALVVAHGAGGSGGGLADVVLLLAGAAALAAALQLRKRAGAAHTASRGLLVAGVGLLLAGFVLSGGERGRVRLEVVAPEDGATVPAGEPVPVVVHVDGGRVASSPDDEEGGHLHLSVDGRLEQMPYGSEATVTLPPGRHTLRVEYVDHRHVSYDPPVAVEVAVEARRG